MRKGEQTRATIVEAALDLASSHGLEGLTIGALAERTGMSKSGVFAHFGSREDLQLSVLKAYERRFADGVLLPALKERRGLPRLRRIVQLWLERTAWEATHGCLWISSATEYDDRPGALRDELVTMVNGWKRELVRAIRQAAEAGHLREDTDPDQLVFEIYGLVLALHHDGRLLKSTDAVDRSRVAFERLLAAHAPRPDDVAQRVLAAVARDAEEPLSPSPSGRRKSHERSI